MTLLSIKIDNRENSKRITKLQSFCVNKGISYEVVPLPVADYLIMRGDEVIAAFEFKTMNDLISSIKSGHMQSQLNDMKEYQHPHLVICGSLYEHIRSGKQKYNPFSSEQLAGFRSKMAIHKVRLVEADNEPQFFYQMFSIADRIIEAQEDDTGFCQALPERHSKSGDVKLDVMCALPGVGTKTAKKYLAHMSVSEFIGICKGENAREFIKDAHNISIPQKLIDEVKKL